MRIMPEWNHGPRQSIVYNDQPDRPPDPFKEFRTRWPNMRLQDEVVGDSGTIDAYQGSAFTTACYQSGGKVTITYRRLTAVEPLDVKPETDLGYSSVVIQ